MNRVMIAHECLMNNPGQALRVVSIWLDQGSSKPPANSAFWVRRIVRNELS